MLRLFTYVTSRQCAQDAGCELEAVEPLPTHDPAGRVYEVGLAGEHQKVNAGLALRLCAAWMEARQRQSEKTSAEPPSGLSGVADGGANHVAVVGGAPRARFGSFQDGDGWRAFLTSVEVHRGLSECVWPGRCQVWSDR